MRDLQEFLLLMARFTGVSTPNGESYGSFRSWWREFLLWLSLPLLNLDLLRLALVPALLLGYKIKARPASTFSQSRAQDIHVSAAAKLSHPGSYELGNRESRASKLCHPSVHLLGRLRDCSIDRSTTLSSSRRRQIGTATSLQFIERDDNDNMGYVNLCNRLWCHWVCWISSSFYMIKILMISIIYVFMTLESTCTYLRPPTFS